MSCSLLRSSFREVSSIRSCWLASIIHMDGLVQSDLRHLRDPTRIIAAVLVHLLGLEHRLHVAVFHAYNRSPASSKRSR